tara:strand:- start:19531 stop:19794 length:264 start_codon:yes stop_codon:yes gene_type:complete
MIIKEIQEFIDEDINPALAMHDGYLLIVEVTEDNVLKIELSGGCQGCSSAKDTIKNAATSLIKDKFPQIESVEDITDHAAGDDPYMK